MTFPFNIGRSSAEKIRQAADLAAADNMRMLHEAAADMPAAEVARELAVYVPAMDLPALLTLQRKINDLVWSRQ